MTTLPMTSVAAVTTHFDKSIQDKQSEDTAMNDITEEKEKESPTNEFNGNHEQPAENLEDELSILADAASKSPITAVPEEIPLEDPNAIPFPASDDTGNDDDDDDDNKKRPAEAAAKKPAAKRVKKQATAKQPVKRSTRARKLPTKLKPRPSSMTSSSSAMSAAAILMGVAASSGGKSGEPAGQSTTTTKKKRSSNSSKKKSGGKEKSGGSSESSLRGITMKRPGKWVSSFLFFCGILLFNRFSPVNTDKTFILYCFTASTVLLFRTVEIHWNLH